MTATIVNAAPLTRLLGTQDLSTRPLVREPEAIPTHLPKTYIYAQKGPIIPQLVVGDSRIQIYGIDTFDVRKKYANHATVLCNLVNAEGNAQMIERILPVDAGPEANVLLSLDVLPTMIPDYVRNTDGSISTDVNGDPVPVMDGGNPVLVAGYKVKWVTSNISSVAGMANFGAATIGPGTQTDPDTLTQSQLYPIIQFKASSVGEDGNNIGVRIWAPDANVSGGVNPKLLAQEKAYPIRMAVIRKPTVSSSAKVVETIFGEQSNTYTFKPGVIDPSTDKQLYIGESFLDSYQNITDVNYAPQIGDFGTVAIYDPNIATLVDLFYTAEKAYIDASLTPEDILTDFTGAADEEHLFNFVSGKSSQAYPYHTFAFDTTGGVTLSEFTNIYAAGSSDGTMNDTLFAGLVAERVAEYNNPNSELLDTAQNVESIIYDSGFPLATKYALLNFMAIRKDTFVVLGTHEVGGATLSASEDNSVAIALRTRAQFFPESDYFGTPAMRAMIMGRSGELRSSQYKTRVPTTMEVAIKSARYMGAGDGRWKNGKHFDGAPGSILDYMGDLSTVYTPAAARNRDWDAGLNWVQRYDRRALFFPALKTVYSDDTSVLNSYFTAMAICEINKVCERAWRHFTGVSNLSNAQLVERVNAFIIKHTEGRFDGRFFIVPNTYFTEADISRGYSWTTAVKLYAPNMKTVMTTFVQAYRIEDYVPATA